MKLLLLVCCLVTVQSALKCTVGDKNDQDCAKATCFGPEFTTEKGYNGTERGCGDCTSGYTGTCKTCDKDGCNVKKDVDNTHHCFIYKLDGETLTENGNQTCYQIKDEKNTKCYKRKADSTDKTVLGGCGACNADKKDECQECEGDCCNNAVTFSANLAILLGLIKLAF